MSLIARAAESIANADIVNVQIRRYRQWQLAPASCLSSCLIPYVSYATFDRLRGKFLFTRLSP